MDTVFTVWHKIFTSGEKYERRKLMVKEKLAWDCQLKNIDAWLKNSYERGRKWSLQKKREGDIRGRQ